jgi:hypothetical protein
VFASPYATHLPAYYKKVLVGGDFAHLITEWAPTSLQVVTVPVFILVFGGFWLLGRNPRAVPIFDQLAFLAMTVVAFQAIRNIAWIGLVSLAVLPPLVDRLRAPVVEPRRLNRILALSMLALTGVALGGILAKPTSWFTHDFPTAAAREVARAAGPHGLVFGTSGYGDWLLWSEPQLAGRVAFDTRVEVLTHAQLQKIQRIEFAAGNWRSAIRPYRVLVRNPGAGEGAPLEDALRRASATHVVFKSPRVVVLRGG